MTQLSNQFAMTPEKGMVALSHGGTEMSYYCQVADDESTALVPAQAVKLVDVAGKTIRVTAATAASDETFGFVAKSVKRDDFKADEILQVARTGSVIMMEASAAIARGASVMIVVSGQKVATQTAGNKVVGIALDKAAADGDLIRVEIQLAAAVATA